MNASYLRYATYSALALLFTTVTAHASLINFDNLSSLQDVGNAYSSLGVHFTPGDFTVLTTGTSLYSGSVSPSAPNVADFTALSGSTISFDTPQSTVSFKYGFVSTLTMTALGPSFSQTVADTAPSFPKIDRYATFSAPTPSITSITFSQQTPDAVIDDLVFSSTSAIHRVKNTSISKDELLVHAAALAGSIAGETLLSVGTGGLATPLAAFGAIDQVIGMGETYLAYENVLDPFDPNYQKVFSPVFQQLPKIQSDATLPQSLADEANTVFEKGSRTISFLEALNVSLNRRSSAIQVGDSASTALQDNAVNQYIALASSELDQYSRGLKQLKSDLTTAKIDVPFTLQDVKDFLDSVRTGGFAALPQSEQSLFNSFGFDSNFQQYVVNSILSIDPNQVPLSLVQGLPFAAEGTAGIASAYAGPSAAASGVPEPGTVWLMGAGLLGLLGGSRRSRRRKNYD